MELRQLHYFVVLAHVLNFTKAAETIGIAQPALSQQIRALELELGVTLLDRTSRRVSLTDAGVAFSSRAEQLLADADEARLEMQEFAGLGRGKIVVGVVPNLGEMWLAHLIADFHQRYPGIEIILIEETTLPLLDLLLRGQLDLALLHKSMEGISAKLTAYPLFTEELVLTVGVEHPLATQSEVTLAALQNENWILVKTGSVIRQITLHEMSVAGFAPHVVCESGSLSTISGLVAAGLGIAILPRSVVRTDQHRLKSVGLIPVAPTRTVMAIWRADAFHAASAREFMDIARHDDQAIL